MTRDIYEQHRAAFPNVSAYAIALDGKRVATIAFKFGNAVTVYLHWLGEPMVKAMAGGGGYDRQSAALASAARRITNANNRSYYASASTRPHAALESDRLNAEQNDWLKFRDALADDNGNQWNNRLRDAGFEVWQAV